MQNKQQLSQGYFIHRFKHSQSFSFELLYQLNLCCWFSAIQTSKQKKTIPLHSGSLKLWFFLFKLMDFL